MRMDFDAQDFAVGYRSVAVAAGKSVDPSISRNVLFEVYPPGVRLVAFDGQMLTVSWVSRRDEMYDVPGVDEAPEETLLVHDPNGRAKGLLAYAEGWQRQLPAMSDDPSEAPRLTLTVSTETAEGTLAGLGARLVTLELEHRERLTLDVSDYTFPEWRHAWDGYQRGTVEHLPVDGVALEKATRLAKITGSPIGFEFGTPSTRLVAINGEPSVEGLLFGAYWNLDENTPVDRPDPSSDDDPAEDEFLEGVDELIDMLDTVAVGS